MKRRQNDSARASAPQIILAVALLSVSAILFASSFKAAPPAAPGRPQSSVVAQDGFFPPLPVPAAPKQDGFYPSLPQGPAPPVPITVSLPTDAFANSVPIATV